MARKSSSLAVLLVVSCLIASLAYVQAGFTGDIPAIRFDKTGQLLDEVSLTDMTVRVGIAKVSAIDPKDEGVRYEWESSAEFSVKGTGKVAVIDPKDEGVRAIDPKDDPSQGGLVAVEDISLGLTAVEAGKVNGKVGDGETVDCLVTLRLVRVLLNGRRMILEEFQIKKSIKPAEVPG